MNVMNKIMAKCVVREKRQYDRWIFVFNDELEALLFTLLL